MAAVTIVAPATLVVATTAMVLRIVVVGTAVAALRLARAPVGATVATVAGRAAVAALRVLRGLRALRLVMRRRRPRAETHDHDCGQSGRCGQARPFRNRFHGLPP